MQPWYDKDRFRLAGVALLVGVALGGLVTVALGYNEAPPAAIPERSDAATPAPTAPPPRPGPHRPPGPPGGDETIDDG